MAMGNNLLNGAANCNLSLFAASFYTNGVTWIPAQVVHLKRMGLS